jgi:hypothetical protein
MTLTLWITEAEKCEAEGAVLTCGSIIQETLGWGLDEDDVARFMTLTFANVPICSWSRAAAIQTS